MKNSASCIFRVVCSMVLLLVTAIPGNAQNTLGRVTVSPVVGFFLPGGAADLKAGFLAGVKLDTQITDSFGIEGDASLVRSSSKVDGSAANIYLVSVQTLFPFLVRPNLTPFMTFGVGGIISSPGESGPFLNFGLGAKYFIMDNIAIRGDVRDTYAMSSMGNNIEFTVGVSYVFGAGSREDPGIYRKKDAQSGAGAVANDSRRPLPLIRAKAAREAAEKGVSAPVTPAAPVPASGEVERAVPAAPAAPVPTPAEEGKLASAAAVPEASPPSSPAAVPPEADTSVPAAEVQSAPSPVTAPVPAEPVPAPTEEKKAAPAEQAAPAPEVPTPAEEGKLAFAAAAPAAAALAPPDAVPPAAELFVNTPQPAPASAPVAEKTSQAAPKHAETVLPKPARRARQLTGIAFTANSVILSADGAIDNFTSFILHKPSRLVVDIRGIRNKIAVRKMSSSIPGIHEVRNALHRGKVRVVLESDRETFPPYRIVTSPEGGRAVMDAVSVIIGPAD